MFTEKTIEIEEIFRKQKKLICLFKIDGTDILCQESGRQTRIGRHCFQTSERDVLYLKITTKTIPAQSFELLIGWDRSWNVWDN